MSEYTFDPISARDHLIQQIQDTAQKQGFSRVVIGISGGKDSTVTAALCARALGKENVYGVMLPDGIQPDIQDSIALCEALGIQHRTANIGPMHDALKAITGQYSETDEAGAFQVTSSRKSDINVGPRLRMTVLRYFAQALDARLAGTGNLSEATVGYCTKDGDTSCDFAVLGKLTSIEVVEVGRTMDEIPCALVEKTPTDGLSGKSDEENLGLRYADIHLYLREGTCGNTETDARIRKLEAANMHKRRMPVILDPFGKADAQ